MIGDGEGYPIYLFSTDSPLCSMTAMLKPWRYTLELAMLESIPSPARPRDFIA